MNLDHKIQHQLLLLPKALLLFIYLFMYLFSLNFNSFQKEITKINQFDKFHVMQCHLFHESLELHVTIDLFKCLDCHLFFIEK